MGETRPGSLLAPCSPAGALAALAHDAHLSPSIDAALDHAHCHVLRNRDLAFSGG